MADKVSVTNELTIELLGGIDTDTGLAPSVVRSRTLKLQNPKSGLTRSQVISALAPALRSPATEGGTDYVPFFFDDADNSIGFTEVGDVNYVQITRTTRNIA